MQVPALSEIAFAKVNLALHVRARRADGYHELESLFAFCADGDVLGGTAREDGALTLAIEGPFADDLSAGEDNLVLRAARALREAAGIRSGADLMLDKRLPVASGIGGGSADAAATLRLLLRLWSISPADVDLARIAAGLGADVPACLGSHTVFGAGIGDKLEPVALDLADMPVLLVNPLVACPTGPVFAAWDGEDRGPLDPRDWARGRNDLAAPAMDLVPEIDEVLAVLRAQLPRLARMSGSGATCFGLFASTAERDAAATRIDRDHPDWWTLSTRLR
ncbi:4-diphosphocytidyl-2-C-methyl-D-erythritol kinase [Sphingobium sp. SYK-6]|uniref:4-(cytidine 5'-diphospho)-2-C-methyl-D-erythritol kinase n=1 Tax=Sphingobium sp. (strain NBRC 103272 / SYK-6) TaxID=627192 RepID=UPI0002277487|nr:4-(cytidine 5'-diphospho)-2-C-methyl-D-erythritol kinase [Sphingobium sp. SYK-6]BAK67126.1 4-diphosphocytidyl-2-C-methyl-D-erythritol kinase [Sphingobium sp. SYK-6]